MFYLEQGLNILNYILDSKQRKHILGGVLLSVSVLFGGLSITIMTAKEENEEE